MKKIKIAITGCLGRMGQHLIKSSKNIIVAKIVKRSRTTTRPIYSYLFKCSRWFGFERLTS